MHCHDVGSEPEGVLSGMKALMKANIGVSTRSGSDMGGVTAAKIITAC